MATHFKATANLEHDAPVSNADELFKLVDDFRKDIEQEGHTVVEMTATMEQDTVKEKGTVYCYMKHDLPPTFSGCSFDLWQAFILGPLQQKGWSSDSVGTFMDLQITLD